uniref:Uncharacterized protein n=1 Tax=Anguilla anguilla TaxID=7936 RepID=A0A0E9XZH4_ANGAN
MTPSYCTTNNIGYLASPKLNKMYSKAMLPNISSILSRHLALCFVILSFYNVMQTLCQIKVSNISSCLMEHIEIHVENCW